MTALVNAHIASIPPGWTLSEGQVAAALAAPDAWRLHYPESAAPTGSEALCVADEEPLAAAQVAYFADGSANIAWIVAHPQAGQALGSLLDALILRARQHGCYTLHLARHTFGVGWLGIPLAWMHLITGLCQAGFVASKQWVLMAGATAVPAVALPPGLPDLRLAWLKEPGAADWHAQVYLQNEMAADCDAWAIPAYFEGCPDAQRWITIEWVGVERPYRQCGLGHWMLSEHLRHLARQGFGQAILWTETANLPMQGLAEKVGFRRGPLCQEFHPLCLAKP